MKDLNLEGWERETGNLEGWELDHKEPIGM